MKRRLLSMILATFILIGMMPSAFAADAKDVLTAGGRITLTEDLKIDSDVTITEDTVLDLNGHELRGKVIYQTVINGSGQEIDANSCTKLKISEGVTVSVLNGELENVSIVNEGTINRLHNLTVKAQEYNAVDNSGVIKKISRCILEGTHGVMNYGDIDLIDNSDITATGTSAVANSMFVSKQDRDGVNTIARITNSRLTGEDTDRGTSFAGGEACNGKTVIEDCVLISHGRGLGAYGGPITIGDCVIINTSKENAVSNTMAVWVVYGAQGSTPPRIEDSTLIAYDGPCGYTELEEIVVEKGDYFSETKKVRVYRELADLENCKFLQLDSVNWKKYASWTMADEPAAPVGLENFRKVNTYQPGQYKDIPADSTFAPNVKTAYELNLMQGYGDTFGVTGNITKLASVIVACRIHAIYTTGANTIDQDYSGTTQEKYMAYAKENGIFCDFAESSGNATRTEFARVLSSALPDEALAAVNTVADNAIPDVRTGDEGAEAIYRLYRAGILNGSDAKGTFYPGSNITRGAACAIATRMADLSLRKSVNLQ